MLIHHSTLNLSEMIYDFKIILKCLKINPEYVLTQCFVTLSKLTE